MSTLRLTELLLNPPFNTVHVLAGDPALAAPRSVHIVESLDDMAELPPHALAVLGKTLTAESVGYRLDIAIRQAATRDASAIVLTGAEAPKEAPATSSTLVHKAGLVLLAASPTTGVTELVIAANATLQGGAELALQRIAAVSAALRQAESICDPGDADAIRQAAEAALGLPIGLDQAPAPAQDDADATDEREPGALIAPATSGHMAQAVEVSLALTAAVMRRNLDIALRNHTAPFRSREAVLSELLVSGDAHSPALVTRAQRFGLAVDGWHQAMMLQIKPSSGSPSLDLLKTIGQHALLTLGADPQHWQVARHGDAVVLIQMWRRTPQSKSNSAGLQPAQEVLEGVEQRFGHLNPRCGVGRIHEGLPGLRRTVAEAKAALNSRPGRRLVAFDQAGLQTMLLEWYHTDTAREAVKDLLAPLESLGGERAHTAISTLQVYLDEQGSLIRVAEKLHLHRNAVAYRMKRISEQLQLDLDDPEHRLALQLACRARLLQ